MALWVIFYTKPALSLHSFSAFTPTLTLEYLYLDIPQGRVLCNDKERQHRYEVSV